MLHRIPGLRRPLRVQGSLGYWRWVLDRLRILQGLEGDEKVGSLCWLELV